MSRIGKNPVRLPKGVSIATSGRTLTVKGPKGELAYTHRPEVEVEVDSALVTVHNRRPARDKVARAYHGMTRALLQNMVKGVSDGFERKLEINGVGYTVKKEGDALVFALGYAHPVRVPIPATVQVDVPVQTQVVIRGCDKQQVGQFAAALRSLKPPEPYKGKGIKYDDEVIRRKAGKAFGSS